MTEYKKNPNKLGALWLKESKKDGKKYFSGVIEVNGVKEKIAVIKNNFKKEEKQPDYVILRKTIKEGEVQPEKKDDGIPF